MKTGLSSAPEQLDDRLSPASIRTKVRIELAVFCRKSEISPTENAPEQDHNALELRLTTDFFLRPLPQLSPQHLSDRALGDFFDERNAASQLLIVCQSFFDESLDLVFAQATAFHGYDIGSWPVGSWVVRSRYPHDSSFSDPWVCKEQILDLGRRDLQAFVLEEFLRWY